MVELVYCKEDVEPIKYLKYLFHAKEIIYKEYTFEDGGQYFSSMTKSFVIIVITENFLKDLACMTYALEGLENLLKNKLQFFVFNYKAKFERIGDIIPIINYWQNLYTDTRALGRKESFSSSDEKDDFQLKLSKLRRAASYASEFLRHLRNTKSWDLETITQDELAQILPLEIQKNHLGHTRSSEADSIPTNLENNELRENIIEILKIEKEKDNKIIYEKLKELKLIQNNYHKLIQNTESDTKELKEAHLLSLRDYFGIEPSIPEKSIPQIIVNNFETIKEQNTSLENRIIELNKEQEDLNKVKNILVLKLGLRKNASIENIISELDQFFSESQKRVDLKILIDAWIEDVSKAKIKKVVTEILSYSRKNNLNNFIESILHISVRLNTIEKQKDSGMLEDQQYYLHLNQISSSLLKIILEFDS